jgi:hypothetical protein
MNSQTTNQWTCAFSLTNDHDQLWDSGLREFQTVHTLNPSGVPSLWTTGSAATYPLLDQRLEFSLQLRASGFPKHLSTDLPECRITRDPLLPPCIISRSMVEINSGLREFSTQSNLQLNSSGVPSLWTLGSGATCPL